MVVPGSAPAPATHNAQCQQAISPQCVCPCYGMLHQTDILERAFASGGTGGGRRFVVDVTNLFGSAFMSSSADPGRGDKVRRSRTWKSIATASTGQQRSQIEQRIVDTALHEVLLNIYRLPLSCQVRHQWLNLFHGVTDAQNWHGTSQQIRAVARSSHNANSGYFWPGVLASASALLAHMDYVTYTDIADFPGSVSTDFDHARYPRGRTGSSIKSITEMTCPQVVQIAANVISSAINMSSLPRSEKQLIVSVTAVGVTPDLWRHPAVVRWALVPALKELRASYGVSFSLDRPRKPLEALIEDELGRRWSEFGAW